MQAETKAFVSRTTVFLTSNSLYLRFDFLFAQLVKFACRRNGLQGSKTLKSVPGGQQALKLVKTNLCLADLQRLKLLLRETDV